MKKLYLLLFTISSFAVTAQIEGTWRIAEITGSLAVTSDSGAQGDNYWQVDNTVINDRPCLFDDSITFSSGNVMIHYMDGETWREPWQGVDENCGEPVAPHNGGEASYIFENNLLTVSGLGAHIGIAKVYNDGELTTPDDAVDSISYRLNFYYSDSAFTADIAVGDNWWRFIYVKTSCLVNPPSPPSNVPEHNVTFNVHTDLIAGSVSSDGIYIGGGFVGSNNALLLEDADGDGIWSGSKVLPAAGGNFTILNGNCPDWSCKENISGQPCANPNHYDDRNHLLGGFGQDTTLNLQYGSCADPGGVSEINKFIKIYPNPNNGVVNISSDKQINSVKIYNMIGNLVFEEKSCKSNSLINIQDFINGVYFVVVDFEDGSFNNTKLIRR